MHSVRFWDLVSATEQDPKHIQAYCTHFHNASKALDYLNAAVVAKVELPVGEVLLRSNLEYLLQPIHPDDAVRLAQDN